MAASKAERLEAALAIRAETRIRAETAARRRRARLKSACEAEAAARAIRAEFAKHAAGVEVQRRAAWEAKALAEAKVRREQVAEFEQYRQSFKAPLSSTSEKLRRAVEQARRVEARETTRREIARQKNEELSLAWEAAEGRAEGEAEGGRAEGGGAQETSSSRADVRPETSAGFGSGVMWS